MESSKTSAPRKHLFSLWKVQIATG